jgi:hypothetical protein
MDNMGGDPGIYTHGPAARANSDVYSRYGLHRYSEVQTGQQVQDQVNQQMQDEYGPLAGVIMTMVKAPGEVDDKLDAQAASLKNQGVLIRSAPPAPDSRYITFSHDQLHKMVNNGVDPGTVGEIGDKWTEIGNKLATFQDDIARAISSSETEWTGNSGYKPRQAVADFGNRAGESGTSAQLAGTLFTQQSRVEHCQGQCAPATSTAV